MLTLDLDAMATLRFRADEIDADQTSVIELPPPPRRERPAARRRRMIQESLHGVERLRELVAAGWDVRADLAREERRLAKLEAAQHAASTRR